MNTHILELFRKPKYRALMLLPFAVSLAVTLLAFYLFKANQTFCFFYYLVNMILLIAGSLFLSKVDITNADNDRKEFRDAMRKLHEL